MPVLISDIEALSRLRLNEPTPRFWSSAELVQIIILGIKDLWRDIADLKDEHFLTVNNTDVTFPANSNTLSGVPSDVHKIFLVEARDITENSANRNVHFQPLEYTHDWFTLARTRAAVDPSNEVFFYAVHGAGAPVGAPTIRVAPQSTSAINITLAYVPTFPESLALNSQVPIPGEADNALVAWTVAFARAKEREDRAPDPNWLAVYATEKQHLLHSLSVRTYQEERLTDSVFDEYW